MTQEDRDAELGNIEFSPEYHEDRIKDFLIKNEDDWLWEHEDGGYSEDEDIQFVMVPSLMHQQGQVVGQPQVASPSPLE